MIRHLAEHYPVHTLCSVLDCARSSYYFHAVEAREETALLSAIEHLIMRAPFLGYRRIHQYLLREGWTMGEGTVRRLLAQLGHTCRVGRLRVRTTDSRQPHDAYPNLIRGLVASYPDQVWVADITYLRWHYRFIYVAVILDLFSRAVRGWWLSRSVDQQLTVHALTRALATRHPTIFHSDQGSQYTAQAHTSQLHLLGVQISMAEVGQPTQNAVSERFIRTLKEEHVAYAEYLDYDDAWRQLEHWLEVEYMRDRIHSSLGYLTPLEFEQAFLAPNPPLTVG